MGRKGAEISLDVKEIIITHFKKGITEQEIAEIVGRPRTTIHYIIDKYKKTKSIENVQRSGRPKKLNEVNERWILREIKKNPKINATVLTKQLEHDLNINVTPQTVRNVIHSNDYHARSARKKPHISKKNRKARVDFAKAHVNKPMEFWMKTIFADESKFNLFGCDGKVLVYRKPNSELEERNMVPTVKHGGGGVMVWGCMGASGVGNLVFIDGIMDHQYYINLLKENLKPSAEILGVSSDFHYYQDNDPKHMALNTRLWMLYNCPNVIKPPAQSPDLNPIEHLWACLEQNIRKRNFRNKNQLKAILLEEWHKIDQNYILDLVKSMPKRLKAVIKQKGRATKY